MSHEMPIATQSTIPVCEIGVQKERKILAGGVSHIENCESLHSTTDKFQGDGNSANGCRAHEIRSAAIVPPRVMLVG